MDDRTRLSLEDLGRVTPRPGDNAEHERKRRQLVGRVFWTRSRKETFAAWLFIFPDCIGLLVFVAIPMVLALSLGFFSVDGFGGYRFVGLANYNRMVRDPLFIKSLGVTIVYVLCLVPGLYVCGLGLALLVRQRIPLIGLWRSLFFMPYVVSLVVVALIWKVMLIDKVGFINRMLELVGLQGRSWLGDPNLALGAVLVVTIWFLMGYYMIIFLSRILRSGENRRSKLLEDVHTDNAASVATDQFLCPPCLDGVRGFGFSGIRSHLCHDKWGTGKFDVARGFLHLSAGV
jgi:ABC-type polysaccharide transport system permease subunit